MGVKLTLARINADLRKATAYAQQAYAEAEAMPNHQQVAASIKQCFLAIQTAQQHMQERKDGLDKAKQQRRDERQGLEGTKPQQRGAPAGARDQAQAQLELSPLRESAHKASPT